MKTHILVLMYFSYIIKFYKERECSAAEVYYYNPKKSLMNREKRDSINSSCTVGPINTGLKTKNNQYFGRNTPDNYTELSKKIDSLKNKLDEMATKKELKLVEDVLRSLIETRYLKIKNETAQNITNVLKLSFTSEKGRDSDLTDFKHNLQELEKKQNRDYDFVYAQVDLLGKQNNENMEKMYKNMNLIIQENNKKLQNEINNENLHKNEEFLLQFNEKYEKIINENKNEIIKLQEKLENSSNLINSKINEIKNIKNSENPYKNTVLENMNLFKKQISESNLLISQLKTDIFNKFTEISKEFNENKNTILTKISEKQQIKPDELINEKCTKPNITDHARLNKSIKSREINLFNSNENLKSFSRNSMNAPIINKEIGSIHQYKHSLGYSDDEELGNLHEVLSHQKPIKDKNGEGEVFCDALEDNLGFNSLHSQNEDEKELENFIIYRDTDPLVKRNLEEKLNSSPSENLSARKIRSRGLMDFELPEAAQKPENQNENFENENSNSIPESFMTAGNYSTLKNDS